MRLLEFPIRRYQFTIIAFALLVALGITALRGIPRQEDPYFPIPIYQIVIAYPGAEPQDVERLVAKPIEDRLSELDDVKKIESHSNDGVAVIVAEFYSSVDTEKKYDEVVREINALRPTLPAELTKVEIKKSNPGLVNIVQFALVSPDAPYRELEDYASVTSHDLQGPLVTIGMYTRTPPRSKLTSPGRLPRNGTRPNSMIPAT